MKKFKSTALFILLITLTASLYSCLDETEGNMMGLPENGSLGIGTVMVPDAHTPREFYFALDKGITIYPGDTTHLKNYKITDGQRVFLGYIPKEEPVTGYDVNGIIYSVQDILTKDIIPLTEETADSIGNDAINITAHVINKEYVTLEYQYLGSKDENKKHMLNLVENQTSDADTEEGYICLEFRHNAFDDLPLTSGSGVVSFKLANIKDKMKDKKGLKIRVSTIYDGIQDYKADF